MAGIIWLASYGWHHITPGHLDKIPMYSSYCRIPFSAGTICLPYVIRTYRSSFRSSSKLPCYEMLTYTNINQVRDVVFLKSMSFPNGAGGPPLGKNSHIFPFLASQDALEVIVSVSEWVRDSKNRVDWCDPGEWRYLLRTLLTRLW